MGGLELDPLTIVEVVEVLSRADGSAGWTTLIGNSTSFFAWLEPSVAEALIGSTPDFCSTSMFGPMGQAHPAGQDAYTVSGRWPFNSGCPHAEWLQVGVLVMEGSDRECATRPIRTGGSRSCHTTWRVSRTPGTPSVSAGPAVTTSAWTGSGFPPSISPPRCSSRPATTDRCGASACFDLAGVLMFGFPLGVARRALDEFTVLARTKFRGNPANTLAGNGHTQVLLARAESRVRAARLYVYERGRPGVGHLLHR